MTMSNYPNTEGFAYSFSRAELSMGPGLRKYTAISNVSADQPTESEAVMGTRPFPLEETEGEMALGEGTVTFSSEGERAQFIGDLGDAYREKKWTLTWILSARGKPNIKKVCYGCRCLSEPIEDESGAAPLGGDITFSFMFITINGRAPHSGLPAPTRP